MGNTTTAKKGNEQESGEYLNILQLAFCPSRVVYSTALAYQQVSGVQTLAVVVQWSQTAMLQ